MAAAPVVVDYDPDLSKGVHYEVLPADDFERSTKSFKCGFVKLKPYNQVGKLREDLLCEIQTRDIITHFVGPAQVLPPLREAFEGL